MALEQLEIKRDVEAVAKGIGDGLVGRNCLIFISSIDSNPRRVSVTRGVNALVLVIFPLRGRHLAIVAAVEDITVVYGHHLIAGDFDCGLLHDGAAEVLNHSPVGIFTIKGYFECQAGSPWDDDLCAKVRELN